MTRVLGWAPQKQTQDEGFLCKCLIKTVLPGETSELERERERERKEASREIIRAKSLPQPWSWRNARKHNSSREPLPSASGQGPGLSYPCISLRLGTGGRGAVNLGAFWFFASAGEAAPIVKGCSLEEICKCHLLEAKYIWAHRTVKRDPVISGQDPGLSALPSSMPGHALTPTNPFFIP